MFVILGFHHGVNEIFSFLGCYTAQIGISFYMWFIEYFRKKKVFKVCYSVEYCLLLKAVHYTAIELNLNYTVRRALMETSPLTETASSALPLPSTPMWKRAISFTGISSRFLNVRDTLLVSETEHTNGQPERHKKLHYSALNFTQFLLHL